MTVPEAITLVLQIALLVIILRKAVYDRKYRDVLSERINIAQDRITLVNSRINDTDAHVDEVRGIFRQHMTLH